MRKLVLGLVAAAAIAAPVAMAVPANAATPGTLDTTTYSNGTTYHHVLTTDYTCGVGADGKTVVNFQIIFDGGSGSGVLVPDSANGGTFAFDGATGELRLALRRHVRSGRCLDRRQRDRRWRHRGLQLRHHRPHGRQLRQRGRLVHRHPDLPHARGSRHGDRQPRRVRLRCRARWHQGQGTGRDRQGRDPGRPVQRADPPHHSSSPRPTRVGGCFMPARPDVVPLGNSKPRTNHVARSHGHAAGRGGNMSIIGFDDSLPYTAPVALHSVTTPQAKGVEVLPTA